MSVSGKDVRCWFLAALVCLTAVLSLTASEPYRRTQSQSRNRNVRVVRLDDHDQDHSFEAVVLSYAASDAGWQDGPDVATLLDLGPPLPTVHSTPITQAGRLGRPPAFFEVAFSPRGPPAPSRLIVL